MSYYSITFTDANDSSSSKNTWTDWKLVPESPPVIPAPKPKDNFVEIPGRLKGPIDMSRAVFNRLTYERNEFDINFAIYEDYWTTPNANSKYNTIRSWLHGKNVKITLEEDGNHYYIGRCTVAPPNRDKTPFVIKISFNLEPVRYNTNGNVDSSWINS